jgi:hypothetical protein
MGESSAEKWYRVLAPGRGGATGFYTLKPLREIGAGMRPHEKFELIFGTVPGDRRDARARALGRRDRGAPQKARRKCDGLRDGCRKTAAMKTLAIEMFSKPLKT